ncbi:MAG: C4-dicarboxylate ABC transporter [Gammaproteobacteria bacterium]
MKAGSMFVFAGLFCLSLLPFSAAAVDTMTFELGGLSGDGWSLEGIRLDVSGLNENRPRMVLSVDRLHLPDPLNVFSSVSIRCPDLRMKADKISCRAGRADLESTWLDSPSMGLSFDMEGQDFRLSLSGVKIFGGSASVAAELAEGRWSMRIDAKKTALKQIHRRFKIANLDAGNGAVDLKLDAAGHGGEFRRMGMAAKLSDLSMQTADGLYACEKLQADLSLDIHRQSRNWLWSGRSIVRGGAAYIDPVYLETGGKPVELTANGVWRPDKTRIDVDAFRLNHAGLGKVEGKLQLRRNGGVEIEQASLSLETQNLKGLSTTYVQPFFTATSLEGLGFSGKLKGLAEFVQGTLTELDLAYVELDVTDASERLALRGGDGEVSWTSQKGRGGRSRIAWKNLSVFNVPVDATELFVAIDGGGVVLERPADVPLLSGRLVIRRFSWMAGEDGEPDVHFEGDIRNVSLEKLSSALKWKPLSGTIAGRIPGVRYRKGRLEINGEVQADLFDGNVRVKKLAASELFGDLPRLYADVEIDRLDLKQLTQTFEFGAIEGRLSGYVSDLYIENWKPVTFYAWLGTPEDDESRHRISQKAVENLTSIGGGGAAGLLSRSFLGFFDTFGYDRLGIGCYLHNGVCQLIGVGPARDGYYIVKGGGLPRIDVIGYNSRIDWNVLLERLSRVTGVDEAVIE